jgi:hypothetical protein
MCTLCFFAGLAESTDLVNWQKILGPLDGGAVMGPSNDDTSDTATDAFDSLCIGVGDVRMNASNHFEMLYFGGSNLGTQG